MKALILAGGYGKRLRPLTDDRPKPMIEILNKPILAWQLSWLKLNGIDDVILCIGYRKEIIIDYVSKNIKDMNVYYSVEDEPLGTGGAIKNVYKSNLLKDEDKFIVINGDIITDLNISKMIVLGSNSSNSNSIAVVPLPSPYGIVEIDDVKSDNARVLGFKEKPRLDQFWINAGVYYLSINIIDYLPEKGSIEYDTFPLLVKEGKLNAVKYNNVYWRSIDTHKDVEEASKELMHMSKSS
jgi:mannose-1-phosphate guanylyltransferase